jgi:hypothetical protein
MHRYLTTLVGRALGATLGALSRSGSCALADRRRTSVDVVFTNLEVAVAPADAPVMKLNPNLLTGPSWHTLARAVVATMARLA